MCRNGVPADLIGENCHIAFERTICYIALNISFTERKALSDGAQPSCTSFTPQWDAMNKERKLRERERETQN